MTFCLLFMVLFHSHSVAATPAWRVIVADTRVYGNVRPAAALAAKKIIRQEILRRMPGHFQVVDPPGCLPLSHRLEYLSPDSKPEIQRASLVQAAKRCHASLVLESEVVFPEHSSGKHMIVRFSWLYARAGSYVSSEMGWGYGDDWREALHDAISKSLTRASAFRPVKISAAAGNRITFNRGNSAFLTAGDTLILFKSDSENAVNKTGFAKVVGASGDTIVCKRIGSRSPSVVFDRALVAYREYLRICDDRQLLGWISKQYSPTTEIALHREPCLGPCPVYTVTLRSDGSVLYIGEREVPRIGTFIGHVGIDHFLRLAEAVQKRRFSGLENEYNSATTDAAAATITVVRNGHRKSVRNYDQAGPGNLWELEKLIDVVVDEVADWKAVTSK